MTEEEPKTASSGSTPPPTLESESGTDPSLPNDAEKDGVAAVASDQVEPAANIGPTTESADADARSLTTVGATAGSDDVVGRIQLSRFYRQITAVFQNLPDVNDQKDYVRAVHAAFNQNSGSPQSARDICGTYGFNFFKARDYFFVLAKRHATEFFVEDAQIPGVNPRTVRDMQLSDFIMALGSNHDPLVRGRSSYYFTPAEWIVALDIRATLPLPTPLKSFTTQVGLML